MVRTIFFLIAFSLFTTSISAQNWRPFNPNDTVRHYLAEDTLGYSNYPNPQKPILSIKVDSSYMQGIDTVQLFLKGYSQLEVHPPLNHSKPYPVVSRILGNKIVYKRDSTIVQSFNLINGFTYYNLYFPSKIPSTSFILGNSDSTYFNAIVDSNYQQHFVGFGLDSVKRLRITTSPIYPGNSYSTVINGVTIELAKNHGLLRTVDFASFKKLAYYNHFRFTDTNQFYTNRHHYLFSVGDEVHYSNTYNLTGPGYSSGYESVKVKILTKQVRNDTLMGTYQYSSIPLYVNLPAVNEVRAYRISLNDTIIRSKLSQVYANSNQFLFCYPLAYPHNHYYTLNEKESKYQVSYISSTLNHRFSLLCDSVDTPIGGVSGNHETTRIGVGFPSAPFDYYLWGVGGVGIANQSRTIVYATISGDTIGSPLNFATSLKTLDSKSDEVSLFPNPAKESLFWHATTTVNELKILDQSGRQLMQLLNPSSNINVSELEAGLYFIQLVSNEGTISTKKFIKQ